MNQRQQTRRVLFKTAFSTMPMWETWVRETPVPVPSDVDSMWMFPSNYIAEHYPQPTMPQQAKDADDFRLIPRRKRRQMARELSGRQWKVGVR